MNRLQLASLLCGAAYSVAACATDSTTPPEQGPFYSPTYEKPARGHAAGATDVTTDTDDTEPARPTKLTIRAALDANAKAKHVLGSTDVTSSLKLSSDATTAPALGTDDAPDLTADDVAIALTSPDPGGCTPKLHLDFENDTLFATFDAVDELGSLDCSDFLDAVATDGFTAKVTNVPWMNAGEDDARLTVKLTMSAQN